VLELFSAVARARHHRDHREEPMNRNHHDALALAGTAALTAIVLTPAADIVGALGARAGDVLYGALGGAAWLVPAWLCDEALGHWNGRQGGARRRIHWARAALLAVVALGLGGIGGRLGDRLGGVLTDAIGFGAHLLVLGAFVWAARRWLGPQRVQRVAAQAAGLLRRAVAAWEQVNVQLERERISRALVANAGEVVTVIDAPARTRAVPPPLPRRRGVQCEPAPVVEPNDAPELEAAPIEAAPRTPPRGYKLPSVGLLTEPAPRSTSNERDELKRIERHLELQLHGYGVLASSVKSTRGPVVDLFELAPVPGQPLAAIKKLGPELEMQHAGLRIVPMPGSGRIGFEVPRAES
jgi:hypothetical protein